MEGRVVYRTRSERKSFGGTGVVLTSPPPRPDPSLDLKYVVEILSQFVPLEIILREYYYLLSKKFRLKLIKMALIHQPDFIEDPANRRRLWMLLARRGSSECLYDFYLNEPRTPELVSEVDRDIVRTMPSHPLFALNSEVGSINREKLKSVLLAIASAEPTVGYCQGMNFVACHLLLNLNLNCGDSFFMFLSILRNYHFKYLYSPSVPLLPLRMFTFSRLVRQHVPQVWHHLNSKSYSVEIFATQWQITLFAYYIDPSVLGPHIWTLFFLQGWKVIYQIGLAILSLLQDEICKMDVEEISSFMASSRTSGNPHPFSVKGYRLKSELLFAVSKFRIKNSDLDKLANQYLSEKLMQAISDELDLSGDVSDAKSTISSNGGTVEDLEEVSSRCLGFSWLKLKDSDEFIYLRIDLSAFSTRNRPHEQLDKNFKAQKVNIPVTSLRQIQRTLDLISQRMNKEISIVTNHLKDIEKRLTIETKQFNALVVNASRLEEQFKEITAKKSAMAETLRETITGGRQDVRDLVGQLSELEREYDAQKEETTAFFSIITEQEDKLAVIGKEKSDLIVRISSLAAELEETQNDVISRSILSAIDSFASIS